MGESRGRGVEPRKLGKTDVRERAADGEIQPLPAAPHPAGLLDAAVAVAGRTIGER